MADDKKSGYFTKILVLFWKTLYDWLPFIMFISFHACTFLSIPQDYFKDMKNDVGIDLENIVYYRGNTHYFVMTALRKSLLDKGVILQDMEDRKALLAPNNINKDKLHEYAITAAQYSTKHFSTALPTQEFALNARGIPDCAIFDFTNLYSARNSSMVKVRSTYT